MLLTGTLE